MNAVNPIPSDKSMIIKFTGLITFIFNYMKQLEQQQKRNMITIVFFIAHLLCGSRKEVHTEFYIEQKISDHIKRNTLIQETFLTKWFLSNISLDFHFSILIVKGSFHYSEKADY